MDFVILFLTTVFVFGLEKALESIYSFFKSNKSKHMKGFKYVKKQKKTYKK